MEREAGARRWAVLAMAIIVAVAIGAIAYQAGVSQGIALQPPPAVAAQGGGAANGAQATQAPYPYYGYRYYGPWRFGFFGPVFSIILLVFVLRAIMWGLFGWGLGWGWRRWRYYDHPGYAYGPPQFDEWHRRAHEQMRDGRGPSTPA